MIISRHKYERDLREAYEKGRYEAEDRCYRDQANARLCEQINKLNAIILRKLEGKKDPAKNVPFGCPFD